MKYPVSSWQFVLRELQCFLFGHKWKYAPRRRTIYGDNPPYRVSFWEDIPWWRAKCKRCRHKGSIEPWTVWYKHLWWAIRSSANEAVWWGKQCFTDDDYYEASLFRRTLLVVPVCILSGWINFFIHFERLPWFVWTYPHDWRDSLFHKGLRYKEYLG